MMRIIVAMTILMSMAATASAFECKPGRYVGRSWSANPAHHDKAVMLEISGLKDKCVMKFKGTESGANEIWELSGNKLVQRETDAAGKESMRYGATLEVRDGVEGFYVDCAGGDAAKCDAGGDPRSFWKVENKGDKVVYSLWGVDPAKAVDPKAQARKRIEYTFTPSP